MRANYKEETHMKKLLAILLALVLALGTCAFAEAVNPDDIEDTMTSADGVYEIAFVTDVGEPKDPTITPAR